jgi:O-antigen/teichoic acid export membrane protein
MLSSSPQPENGPSVRSALLVVFFNRYALLGLGIVPLIILSRLVTPAQTGLFSIAASIVMLAQAIRDFGIAEFLVQEKDLTRDKIRTAFGLNLILAWSRGAIIFLLRHVIADIYETPELAGLVAIVCGSFVVAPFSSTVQALLNRRMDFVALMKISVASNLVSSVVSCGLAYYDWQATALCLGMLASNVTTAVVTSVYLRSWDHFVPSLRAWRELASFGIYMSSANIVNQIGARLPELIIGRLVGLEALGQFNRSRGVVNMFFDLIVSSVNTVAFPAFSAAYRAGEDTRQPYLKVTAMVTGAVLPVLAVVALVAVPLVSVLLGPQWQVAAGLVPIFVIGTIISTLAPIAPAVLSATGNVRHVLSLAISAQVVQVVAMAIFGWFGLYWLAVGNILFGVMYFGITTYHLRSALGIGMLEVLYASKSSLVLMIGSLPLVVTYLLASKGASEVTTLVVVGVLASVSWLAVGHLVRHPISEEIERILRKVFAHLARPRVSS